MINYGEERLSLVELKMPSCSWLVFAVASCGEWVMQSIAQAINLKESPMRLDQFLHSFPGTFHKNSSNSVSVVKGRQRAVCDERNKFQLEVIVAIYLHQLSFPFADRKTRSSNRNRCDFANTITHRNNFPFGLSTTSGDELFSMFVKMNSRKNDYFIKSTAKREGNFHFHTFSWENCR